VPGATINKQHHKNKKKRRRRRRRRRRKKRKAKRKKMSEIVRKKGKKINKESDEDYKKVAIVYCVVKHELSATTWSTRVLSLKMSMQFLKMTR